MWLFTRFGFYSVTVTPIDNGNPLEYQIRARRRSDLDNLIDFMNDSAFGFSPWNPHIHDEPQRDYRYRIYVSAAEWQDIGLALAQDVDYTNFKNTVTDHERGKIYTRVWAIMTALQNEPIPDYDAQLSFLDERDDTDHDPHGYYAAGY